MLSSDVNPKISFLPRPRPLIAIVGPTSSGKSRLGIALAQRFYGEIINCDSIQIYRGIDVATGKPSTEDQQGIPHHLYDFLEPTEQITAVEWATLARAVIADIESRRRMPLLVGGAGFYLRALAVKFFEAPEIHKSLRPRLERILHRHGIEYLHKMLKRVDPMLAERYVSTDRHRIMRGLEIFFSAGEPQSTLQTQAPQESTEEGSRLKYLVLQPPRDQLYQRINDTVELMVQRGLVEEIQTLMAHGVPASAKVFNALGYKRFVEYLLGQRTFESAIEQMKLDTRHLAKRQWSWWRSQQGTHWLEGFGFEDRVIEQATDLINLNLYPVSHDQGKTKVDSRYTN
jgi:tRNA dimethylallyltransferase